MAPARSPAATPASSTKPSDDEEGEAVLDTEWAGAVAPSANLLFMTCKTTTATAGIFLSAEAVIYNNLANTMSLSYGEYEGGSVPPKTPSPNDLWEQAAAQGETVVVSSGDSGSDAEDQDANDATHGLNVSGFSSTAYNVSAGGTDFQDAYNQGLSDTTYQVSTFWNATNTTGDSSAKSYVPETTWNDTCAGSLASYYVTGQHHAHRLLRQPRPAIRTSSHTGGGSGGISTINARPSWQNATVYGLPATPAYRLLPDVSLFASNGFWGHILDYYESDVSTTALQFAGGTSFVAPQLAGVFALINQSTGERQGQPDYVLYTMAGIEYGTTTATGACNGSGATGIGTTSSLPASSCIFNDVETGNISQGCRKGSPNCYNDSGNYGILSTSTTADSPAYPAGEGYDLATGLGSINIANLVDNWQSTTNSILYTPTVALTTTPRLLHLRRALGHHLHRNGLRLGQLSHRLGLLLRRAHHRRHRHRRRARHQRRLQRPRAPAPNPPPRPTLPPARCPAALTPSPAPTAPPTKTTTRATGTIGLTVNKQTPTLTVSNATTPAGNLTVTLTATLAFTGTGLAPTGGVNFTVNGGAVVNGTCTGTTSPITCTASYPISTLAAGTYTISASYPGDTNYNAVGPRTATLTITSNPSTLSFSVSSPQHTMVPTINLSATSNNASGALTYSVVSGPATVTGSTWQRSPAQAPSSSRSARQPAQPTASPLRPPPSPCSREASGSPTPPTTSAPSISSATSSSPAPASAGAGVGTVATPQGVAFDSSGDLWVASSTGVSEFNRYGVASQLHTAHHRRHLDSALCSPSTALGTVWIANANGSVSAISNTGTALSPSTGFAASSTASTIRRHRRRSLRQRLGHQQQRQHRHGDPRRRSTHRPTLHLARQQDDRSAAMTSTTILTRIPGRCRRLTPSRSPLAGCAGRQQRLDNHRHHHYAPRPSASLAASWAASSPSIGATIQLYAAGNTGYGSAYHLHHGNLAARQSRRHHLRQRRLQHHRRLHLPLSLHRGLHRSHRRHPHRRRIRQSQHHHARRARPLRQSLQRHLHHHQRAHHRLLRLGARSLHDRPLQHRHQRHQQPSVSPTPSPPSTSWSTPPAAPSTALRCPPARPSPPTSSTPSPTSSPPASTPPAVAQPATATACGNLFALAVSSTGAKPTDVVTAALNIAHNPALNVINLNKLADATGPFQPILSSAPPAWTIAIQYPSTALSAPTGIAADQSGNLWITNKSTHSVTLLSPTGSVTGTYATGQSGNGAIAIDLTGNAWVAGNTSGSLVEITPHRHRRPPTRRWPNHHQLHRHRRFRRHLGRWLQQHSKRLQQLRKPHLHCRLHRRRPDQRPNPCHHPAVIRTETGACRDRRTTCFKPPSITELRRHDAHQLASLRCRSASAPLLE